MSEKRLSQPNHARFILRDLFTSERYFPIVCASFSFLLWLAFFILSGLFSDPATCFAKNEIETLSVFRYKFQHADFNSYTFRIGLGMSIPRLMLTGSGGLLTIPFCLFPESVYPQAILSLSALRLSLSAFCFAKFLSLVSGKKTFLRVFLLSLIYTSLTFSLSLFLSLPVSGTYIMLPLALFLTRKTLGQSGSVLSPGLIIVLFLYLTSNSALALLLLPFLAVGIFLLAKNTKDSSRSRTFIRLSAPLLLSICLSGIILIPRVLQIPALLRDRDPASSLLQNIGSDTAPRRTDMTYSSPVTELLFGNPGSVFVANGKAGDFSFSDAPANRFDLLNSWIYSIWPYLPSVPFQTSTTAVTTPEYTSTTAVHFKMSTLFLDPLYASITLPHLSHPVEVRLNGNPVATISQSRKPVIVYLGTFNAGQELILELSSEHPSDIQEASALFGYLNSYDWERYTESANYGIPEKRLSSEGLYAEALAASDSLILTNIPYEKGWKVNLNGTTVTPTAYEDALLSVPVSAGAYQVFFYYRAPGLIFGGLLSGASFLFLAFFHFSRVSPKKSSAKSQKSESR